MSKPLSVQSPSLNNPQIVRVDASTCWDLSTFKDLLKEYRKLDDGITMRFNRATAFARDTERRKSVASGTGTVNDKACLALWDELRANWKRRAQLVQYCVDVVDQSLEEKRKRIESSDDPKVKRQIESSMYTDDVQKNQIHNELTVEDIVRKRSIEALKSRCRYFVPPLNDAEARKMWESAQR